MESLQEYQAIVSKRAYLSALAEGKGHAYMAMVSAGLLSEEELEQILADSSAKLAKQLELGVISRLHAAARDLVVKLGFQPENAVSKSSSGERTRMYLRDSTLGVYMDGGRLFNVGGLKALRPSIAKFLGYTLRRCIYLTHCSTAYENYCYHIESYSQMSVSALIHDFVQAKKNAQARDEAWDTVCSSCDGENDQEIPGGFHAYGIGNRDEFDYLLDVLTSAYEKWDKVPGWNERKCPPVPRTRTPLEARLVDWANRVNLLKRRFKRLKLNLGFQWDDHMCFHEGNMIGMGPEDERLMRLYYEATDNGSGEAPGMVVDLKIEPHRIVEFVLAASLTECVIGELENILHPIRKPKKERSR